MAAGTHAEKALSPSLGPAKFPSPRIEKMSMM